MTNIKSFIGERKKIVAVIVILTLLFTIVFSGVRYKAATNPLKESKDVLNILVINPGNDTKLTTPSGKVKTQYEGSERYVTANVTSVSMPQFIGQVDQLNGKYDAVVITRNVDKTTNYNTLKEIYKEPLQDYTNPAEPYDMFDTSDSIDKEGVPIPEGFKNAYGKGTPDSYRIRNGITTSSVYGERTYVEYYSENDITNKRANEILAMAKSGQLVVLDESIFNGDLDGTKLVSNFKNLEGSNVLRLNSSNITIQNIVDKYFSQVEDKNVKPEITVTNMPTGTKSTAVKDERKIEGNIEIKTGNAVPNEEKVKVDLYLDFNGDTLFKGTDLVYSTYATVNDGTAEAVVNYEMTDSFVGQLDWKIEVSTLEDGYSPSSNVESKIRTKSYTTGIINYVNYSKKKDVKVLQIVPEITLLNLRDNDRMKKYLSSTENEFLNSYKISIDVKTIADVNNLKKIDESYTMIILGFNDTYGGKFDFNKEMIEELKKFAREGKSIMFTHDTMPINVEDAGNKDKSFTGPKRLAQAFRDYIGQARYQDPNRNGDESNIYTTLKAEYDENGKVEGFNEDESATIPHDDIKIHDKSVNNLNADKVYSYGYTDPILMRVRFNNGFLYGDKSKEGELYNQPYMVVNKGVNKLNEGSITSYPYKIDSTIQVALTHNQWYQLNLEDEDVVPWYTLNPSAIADNTVSISNGGAKEMMFRSYDARNYYYTYSKGNITYSGTGHYDSVDNGFTNEELQLFVNTIIKADRACNHAPTLEAKKKEDNKYIELVNKGEMKTDRDKDLNIEITPHDIDLGDRVDVNIIAESTEDEENERWTLINQSGDKYHRSKPGIGFVYNLGKENYSSEKIKKIRITISGMDSQKLEANTLQYTFVLVRNNTAPIIKGYKVEDSSEKELQGEMNTERGENLNLKVIPRDADEGDIITVNIKMEKYSKSTGQWVEISEANKSYNKSSDEKIEYELSKTNYSDYDITKLKVTITGNDKAGAKSNTIETIFNIESKYNLIHGLFDDYSFENNSTYIFQSVNLMGGTYGTFGAQFTLNDSNDSMTITVDEKITNLSNLEAYKVDGSELIKVNLSSDSAIDSTNKKITAKISDSNVKDGNTIIIKYTGLMPAYDSNNLDNNILVNKAKIDDNNIKDAKINVTKEGDLY